MYLLNIYYVVFTQTIFFKLLNIFHRVNGGKADVRIQSLYRKKKKLTNELHLLTF